MGFELGLCEAKRITANDPAPVPHPEPMHGSYHWAFERQGHLPPPLSQFANELEID